MASRFRVPDRDQVFLLATSYRDLVGDDELVWTVIEVVEGLDLSEVYGRYVQPREVGGRPAYDPAMMLTLLVFGYCEGKRSVRELESACRRDVAYQAICGGMVPDHATIARFRRGLDDVLASLFVQVLKACVDRGLVQVGTLALDGTKMEAAASRSANVGAESLARLRAEVERILAEAAAADDAADPELAASLDDPQPDAAVVADPDPDTVDDVAAADAEAGPVGVPESGQVTDPDDAGAGGGWSPRRRRAAAQERLERIERAEQELAGAQQRRDHDQQRRGRARKGQPVVNVTDPESRLQPNHPGFLQGYNGQVVVSGDQIVIAAAVTPDTTDVGMLPPMLDAASANLAAAGVTEMAGYWVADAGYWSAANFALEDRIDGTLLIATHKGNQVGEVTPIDPATATPKAEARHRMQTRLANHTDRYQQRNWLVEGTFAHTKEHRNTRRFQRRGLGACTAEWLLIHIAGNINKIYRHRTHGSASGPDTNPRSGPTRPRHHQRRHHRHRPPHRTHRRPPHQPRHHPHHH